MIRRIELSNFMSHSHTVIEPADGLTVLVGPNNCGKSAVVTALQILCHNENSNYVLRHNERECSVTVTTDDNHTIQWARTETSPRYLINGQLFDRLDRSTPDLLHQCLRLPKVRTDNDLEFDVHFGEQKSPVFLLDKPESHAAQFFASSSDAASLVEMQKLHKQRTAEARKESISLQASIEKLGCELSILSATQEIERSVEEADSQFKTIAQLWGEMAKLRNHVISIANASHQFQQVSQRARAVHELREPPTLLNENVLRQLIASLHDQSYFLEQLQFSCSVFEDLSAPPMLADDAVLKSRLRELQKSARAATLANNNASALRSLMNPPCAPLDTAPITNMARELSKFELELTNATTLVSTKSQEFKELEQQLHNWALHNPTCPLCGGKVDSANLLAHRHSHGGNPS